MSSILSTSPRNNPASSTADKLKSFGLKLNRSFGIAKRWTLEKVGARESEQETPEVAALLAAFQHDKADLEELRGKVAHLIATERSLLDADKSFAQQLAELQIAEPDTHTATGASSTATDSSDDGSSGGQSALSTIEAVSSAFASAPTGSTAATATPNDDTSTTTATASTPSSSSASAATRHPPFTPAAFSAYLTHLHAVHTRYTAALSTALLDPIDQLLTQDVTVCQTMIRQLPLLRLDHSAKLDRLERSAGSSDEVAAREERESREVYEAQLEVVDKLARELHVKLTALLQEVCERYVSESEQYYASQQAVIEAAVRDSEGRMQPVAGVLDAEPTAVKDVMEAAVAEVVDKLDQLGGQMIDGATAQ